MLLLCHLIFCRGRKRAACHLEKVENRDVARYVLFGEGGERDLARDVNFG